MAWIVFNLQPCNKVGSPVKTIAKYSKLWAINHFTCTLHRRLICQTPIVVHHILFSKFILWQNSLTFHTKRSCVLPMGTHILCKFLHNCMQVTSKFGSKHHSYFTETIFSGGVSVIRDARTPRIQFCFYFRLQYLQHPSHGI